MRQAIALSDAALLQHAGPSRPRPSGAGAGGASASGGSSAWLESLQHADAALQAAVARNDAQRFSGAAAGSAADAQLAE